MRRTGPILIIVIGLLALFVDFYPRLRLPEFGPDGGNRIVETKLGLDLEGGLRTEYQALPVNGVSPDAEALGVIRDIVVELPGVDDPQSVRTLIGQTGQLQFVPIPDGAPAATEGQTLNYPPLFS